MLLMTTIAKQYRNYRVIIVACLRLRQLRIRENVSSQHNLCHFFQLIAYIFVLKQRMLYFFIAKTELYFTVET